MCSIGRLFTRSQEVKPVFNFDHKSKDPAEIGLISLPEAWLRENPRPLSSDPNADDVLGFGGVSDDGSVVVARLSRRHGRCTEVLVYLHLPSGEEYQLPLHPETHVYNTDGHKFSAGGLTFEVLEPLRRLRVIFNGYLRKRNPLPGESDTVSVRFNFMWHPIYCFLTFPQDIKSDHMSKLLSKQKSIKSSLPPGKLFFEEWHEQFGELHGILNIDGLPESEIFARGLKSRRHGIFNWRNVQNKISIQGYCHNGLAFHLFVENFEDGVQNFAYGYIYSPCMMLIQHITKCNFKLQMLYDLKDSAPNLSLAFDADGMKYQLEMTWCGSGFHVHGGEQHECQISLKNVDVQINGKPGKGIFECVYRSADAGRATPNKSLPYLEEPDIRECSKLVVSFDGDEECQSSKMVGGKGASLALMSNIADNNMFSVPDGVCITKTAFDRHLNENPHLNESINRLQDIAWTKVPGALQEECKKLVKTFSETELSDALKATLEEKLAERFGARFEEEVRFAVRSSAIGEDSDEMSAAGQNETFLGVRSFAQICTAVQKCWASQFAFRSIEYKRQNGQLFSGGMGVVIQRMVAAEVAGVLFTRDPVTGSASTMIISSNFGLGESVVSAMADPDTVIVRRTWDDELLVQEKQIGTKKVVVTMSDESGVVESEVPSDRAGQCTVTDDLALKLGKVALFLERSFGNARDIEWAARDDEIFLLQSRPVTTDGLMSDFEIIHEFDTAMRTDHEHYTRANIGEVMPGAQSPLTRAILLCQVPFLQSMLTWRIQSHRYDPTVTEFGCFYGHIMSERLMMKAMSLGEEKSGMNKSLEVGFYGRVLDDDEVQQMANDRYSIKPPPKTLALNFMALGLQGVLRGKKKLDHTIKHYGSYPDPTIGADTLTDAYNAVELHLMDTADVMMTQCYATIASTTWNYFTLNTLSQDSGEYTLDQYSDFALLVGTCNGAESGDVPFSLQKLASTVAKEIDPNEFSSVMTTTEAFEWLKNNRQESGKGFANFLERHGHRGLKEFDMSCTSWEMNPEQVVTVLQDMLKNPKLLENQKKTSLDNVINEIKTPLSSSKKRWLSFVMKHCRNAVCYRERAKSLVIKVYEGMRLGYRRVADLMVKEGLIPDPQLIFFFTHEEIRQLMQTRSAKIIRRAKHRQRLHPSMDKLQFEEMIQGYPKPIDENEEIVFPEGTIQITGYPVSQGVIEGLARVVTTFHDVHTIQPGEILITHATDIGWSPYFPILSGVVTEIGGLISHGAVVAREFGLPCIVCAQNATRAFKTGDTVLLNATKGTITKVGQPDLPSNSS